MPRARGYLRHVWVVAAVIAACEPFASSDDAHGDASPPDASAEASPVGADGGDEADGGDRPDGGDRADGGDGGVAPQRATQALVALYTLREGAGSVVKDVSNVAPAHDLVIQNQGAAAWGAQGLTLSGTHARTSGNATKIAACGPKNEVSFEAWVQPKPAAQAGPARVLSMAAGPADEDRVLVLGLGDNDELLTERAGYVVRFNGQFTEAPTGTAKVQMQHLMVTAKAPGTTRLYVDGVEVGSFATPGSFRAWSERPFSLGQETTGERTFQGTYALVAVYCRELSSGEVLLNRAAGPRP